MTGDAHKMESFQTHRVGNSKAFKALHCAYRSTTLSISMLKVDKHSRKESICELSKLFLLLLLLSQPLRKSTSCLSNIDLRTAGTVNAVYNTRLLEIGHLVLRFGQHLPEGQKRLEADSNLQGSLDTSQAFRYSLNIWDDSHSSPFRCRCRSNSSRSSRGVNKGFWVAIQF